MLFKANAWVFRRAYASTEDVSWTNRIELKDGFMKTRIYCSPKSTRALARLRRALRNASTAGRT